MVKLNLNKAYGLFFNKSDDKKDEKIELNIKHAQFNNLLASEIREESLEGRQYEVYPAVMLREAVVNGNFVDSSDLISASWNGVPVTVNHPTVDGEEVSANSPKVLAKFQVGRVFNASMDGDKLKAEVWIDVKKADERFPELRDHLKKNNCEVSTGYFAKDIPNEGEYKGSAHKVQHTDIKPDHFALLPDDVGACSFENGCGIRANSLESFFNKAISKIKGDDKESKLDVKVNIGSEVVNALKTLQSDLEEFLTKGEDRMTEKVKNNCEGLSAEDKADIKFLREQVSEQKAKLKTQAVEKLGMDEKQLETFSIEQLSILVNASKDDAADKKVKKNKDDKKSADYSGRSNATKKTDDEVEDDCSDLIPLSVNSLFAKEKETK